MKMIRWQRLVPVLCVFLFGASELNAQRRPICTQIISGLNTDRYVDGPVNTECPGVLHSAPFGNWGITSVFGPRVDGAQFQGWKTPGARFDRYGNPRPIDPSDYEWNSCTSHSDFSPPNCSYYNAAGCTEQESTQGNNHVGDIAIRYSVQCPRDTDGDGTCDTGGCSYDGRTTRVDTPDLSLYELDPWSPDTLVQIIHYPTVSVVADCPDPWGCNQTWGTWSAPAYIPVGVTADFLIGHRAEFYDTDGYCDELAEEDVDYACY